MKGKVILTLYIVLSVAPLLLGLGYSILYSFELIGLLNTKFTLEHWRNLFVNSDALLSFTYSFYLTGVSLVCILLMALFFSWWQIDKENKLFNSILFVPLCFSPLVAAFAFFYLLSPSGVFSRVLSQLGFIKGIDSFPRLINDAYSIGILLAHIFLLFPLFTLLFASQIKKERMKELLASSKTLGATNNYFFRKVFVPVLLKKSSPLVVLYGIFLFGSYEVPLLLGRSSPRTITVFITDQLTRYNLYDIPGGHAMAVIYTLLVITITTLLLQRSKNILFQS